MSDAHFHPHRATPNTFQKLLDPGAPLATNNEGDRQWGPVASSELAP